MSDEILKTALVIRWWIAAEHWTGVKLIIGCSSIVETLWGKHAIICGDSPILWKRPAPYSEVQDLHEDPGEEDITGQAFDDELLFQAIGHLVVHQQQAHFAAPSDRDHGLFDDEHHLRPIDASLDRLRCQVVKIIRRYKIRVDMSNNVHERNQDRIKAL